MIDFNRTIFSTPEDFDRLLYEHGRVDEVDGKIIETEVLAALQSQEINAAVYVLSQRGVVVNHILAATAVASFRAGARWAETKGEVETLEKLFSKEKGSA